MEGYLAKINSTLQTYNGRMLGPAGVVLTAMQTVEGISHEQKLNGTQKANLCDTIVPQVIAQAQALNLLTPTAANDIMNIYNNMRPWIADLREAFIAVSKLPQMIQSVETEVKGCIALCKK